MAGLGGLEGLFQLGWFCDSKKDKKGHCGHPAVTMALGPALPDLTSLRSGLAPD